MAGFLCPYCNMVMSINQSTQAKQFPSFEAQYGVTLESCIESCIEICFRKCPNCNEYIINATGLGRKVKDINTKLRPKSSAIQYPSYIPEFIRNDYEEACAIINLSPKASATLSRRCLQGMIRDYWKIEKKTLNLEISELQDKLSPDLWDSIDSLRQIGNIGAHMETDTNIIVDIDPNEAETLIKLIELLIKEWYIAREERNNLFQSIKTTNDAKQKQRKGTT